MVGCACRQLRAWMDQGIEPVPLSVNQSKLLFFEADYIPKLQQIIQQYNIPAHWITLEILEGLALENAEELNARIEQLRKIGFHISMDDFGSGYSSLGLLASFRVDAVKLDRRFFQDVSDPRVKSVVASVTALSEKLGAVTVAEGIEDEKQLAFARETGCSMVQGYCFSRPLPIAEFEKWALAKAGER